LQTLAEAMRLTNQARRMDTTVIFKNVENKFLSAEHVAQYQHQLTEIVNKWEALLILA